jgi:hypothetical protein
VKLFTCELGFKKTNGVLFKFLNQKLLSAKASHIPSSVFSLFHWNVKKCVFNMLGLGWFRMKKQISAFSEFCNVGARPVYALSFSNSAGKASCLLVNI